MGRPRFCNCADCKRAKRKGLVLGDRSEGYFSQGVFGWGRVSAYVSFPRFAKGLRVRRGNNRVEVCDE